MKRELLKQSVVIFTILLVISAPSSFAETKSNSSSYNDHMNTFKLTLGKAGLDVDGDFKRLDEPATATFSYTRKSSELEGLPINLVVSYAYLGDSVTIEKIDYDLTGYKFSLGGQFQGNIGNTIAPYIGAGVSLFGIERDDSVNKDNDSTLGYYFQLGSDFYINKMFGLTIDYNKFTGSDLSLVEIPVESDHDQISFGLLLRF